MQAGNYDGVERGRDLHVSRKARSVLSQVEWNKGKSQQRRVQKNRKTLQAETGWKG